MDTLKMLEELRGERDRLSEAIVVLERIAGSSGVKRRGRPPKNASVSAPITATGKRRGRPPGSRNKKSKLKLVAKAAKPAKVKAKAKAPSKPKTKVRAKAKATPKAKKLRAPKAPRAPKIDKEAAPEAVAS